MRRASIGLLAVVCVLAMAGLLLCRDTVPVDKAPGTAALGLMLLDGETGVYVLAVTENSPADAAGIAPGDILLQAGGVQVVSAEQMDELARGEWASLPVTILRDDTQQRLTIRK